jgi:small-conductance mechanosensitive channel
MAQQINKELTVSRKLFFNFGILLFVILGYFLVSTVQAQDLSSSATKDATLTIMNRDIAVFRTTLALATPEVRVKRAQDRINSLTEADLMTKKIEVLPLGLGEEKGMQWYLGEIPLFAMVEKDLDPETKGNLKNLEDKTTEALVELMEAKEKQLKVPFLIHQSILFLLATLILGIAIFVDKKSLNWVSTRLLKKGNSLSKTKLSNGIHWAEYYFRFASKIVSAISWLLIALFIYIWLTFSLRQLPLTEPIGKKLGQNISDTIYSVFSGILGSIPNIISIIIIIFVTRTITDLTKVFFKRVEAGNIQFNLFHKDTVSASQRIATFLLWGLTFSIIYPLIPGSNTEAFKGLSVLFGIVISLGSTGLVSQLMSGLVVIYSRALRVGDYVMVNGQEGVVKELGVLSTKIQSLNSKIETTIPNAVLISNPITNLTKLNETTGTVLSTQVTIGYDAPWREVHAMLIDATKLIPDIKTDPEPKVFQKALSDFYVEYELFIHTNNPIKKMALLSELHQTIQDNFNRAGIQIMSPHFMLQPEHAVLSKAP